MIFKDKTVIITGASRGIGFETAKLFHGAGARVYLMARSHEDLNALSKSLGRNAVKCICDVSKIEDWKNVVSQALKDTGRIDILINNAGTIDPISTIFETNPEDWSKSIDINLKGAFYGCYTVIPIMRKQKSGCIINIGSGAAYSPLEGWSHYCVSKAGLSMLTRSVQLELKGTDIRVMSLSPGTVATKMQRRIKESGINPISKIDFSEHIPAIWPAKTLLWMCSPISSDFTNKEISLRETAIRKMVGLP